MQRGLSDLYALGATVHGHLRHGAFSRPRSARVARDRMLPMARVARRVRKQFGISIHRRSWMQWRNNLRCTQDRPQSVAELLLAMEMDSARRGWSR